MRVVTRLPCRWRTFDTQPQRGDLIDSFGTSQEAAQALRVLDDEIAARLADVPDSATRQLLALLNRKINVLAPQVHPGSAVPAIEIEVSADGICLATPMHVAPGTWAGVWLLIDDFGELVAPALVRHSTPDAGGYRTGLEFTNDADRRPLARLVMRRAQAT